MVLNVTTMLCCLLNRKGTKAAPWEAVLVMALQTNGKEIHMFLLFIRNWLCNSMQELVHVILEVADQTQDLQGDLANWRSQDNRSYTNLRAQDLGRARISSHV